MLLEAEEWVIGQDIPAAVSRPSVDGLGVFVGGLPEAESVADLPADLAADFQRISRRISQRISRLISRLISRPIYPVNPGVISTE